MAQTTGPWRVKGVDRKTRRLARDAAARSGLTMGAWIDRTIKAEAGVPVRENAEPLVTEYLRSARDTGTSRTKGRTEPFLPGSPRSEKPRAAPAKTLPAVASATPTQRSGIARGVLGGVIAVALLVGGYWLVTLRGHNAPEHFASSDRLDADTSSMPATTADRGPSTLVARLTEAAQGGDARAQHDLGLMYVQGNGVPKDPKKGAKLLEQSASAGLPKAQYQVGVLYEKGIGVTKNLQTAFLWYQRAAKQGHIRAQHNLGTFYAEGKGTKQNYAEAAKWFLQASKGGLAESHYSLGMMHEYGLGMKKDERKAAAFYRSALAAGSAQAAAKLAQLEPMLKETSKQVEQTLASKVGAADGEASSDLTTGRTLSPTGIIHLQRLLARLDLGPGPANGVVGKQTVDAIKLYQRFAGLPVDGKPSIDLLRDLRQVVGAMDTDTAATAPQTKSPPPSQ